MWRRTRLLAAVLLLASACQTAGMEFTRTAHLEILTPTHRQELALPIVLTWEPSPDLLERFLANEGELFYGVFVDRPPLAPGANLAGLASENCRRTPGCADTAWFNDRGVYFPVVPLLTLHDLDDLRDDGASGDRDLHTVTIVVMRRGTEDDNIQTAVTGTREGEAAFTREFYVTREDER